VNIDDPIDVSGWVVSKRYGVYVCRAELHQGAVLAVRASAKFVAMPYSPQHSPAE